jgi:hypothetical protein
MSKSITLRKLVTLKACKDQRAMAPAQAEHERATALAWAERMSGDPLARLLDEWSAALREFLVHEGIEVLASPGALLPRTVNASIDGGFVQYREGEISPAAAQAINALSEIESTRLASGDWRALRAFNAGTAIERTRATASWARAIHAGVATMRGGRKCAAQTHGPAAAREAQHIRWCARFAELRRKFPEADKDDLLDIISAEPNGKSARTLRRYIKAK